MGSMPRSLAVHHLCLIYKSLNDMKMQTMKTLTKRGLLEQTPYLRKAPPMTTFVPHDDDIILLDEELFQAPVRSLPLSTVGITVYLIEITPKIAEIWLKRKNKNRSIHLSQLAKLKRALEQDRWEVNGETIIFDGQGQLIEGQHRLQACVDTGIVLWSLVVHGIDQERFKTMGQGSKRTAGDILGIRGEKNSRNLAAALRWVWRYEQGQMMNPHPLITDDELADTLETHQAITLSIPYGNKPPRLIAPGLTTALHYLCSRQDKALANHFFWSFTTGENLSEGNPILVLRNTLTQRSKLRRIVRDELKAPMVIHAWNLLRKNRHAVIGNSQKLIWRGRIGQKYPVIL